MKSTKKFEPSIAPFSLQGTGIQIGRGPPQLHTISHQATSVPKVQSRYHGLNQVNLNTIESHKLRGIDYF